MEGRQNPPRRHPLDTVLQWTINTVIVAPVKLVTAAVAALMLKPMRELWGQMVPYSNRKHLIWIPECLEKFIGKMAFEYIKVCNPAERAREAPGFRS